MRQASQRAGGLAALWRWWVDELARLIPPRLARAGVTTLAVAPDAARLVRGRRELARADMPDAETAAPIGPVIAALLAQAPRRALRRAGRLEVAFDPSMAIERTAELPPAKPKDIPGLLEFEVERLTPFRADEVYYGHALDLGTAPDGGAQARFRAVPRRIADEVLHEMGSHGRRPRRMVVAQPGARLDRDQILALPPAMLEAKRASARIAIAAILVVIGVTAAFSPLLRLHVIEAELAESARAAQAQLGMTEVARSRLAEREAALHAIVAAKRKAASPLAIIEALARALPDGTWLTGLTIADGSVVIEGETGDSAGLVGRIEAAPQFGAVTYLAPIAKTGPRGRDRFRFSVTLAEAG